MAILTFPVIIIFFYLFIKIHVIVLFIFRNEIK